MRNWLGYITSHHKQEEDNKQNERQNKIKIEAIQQLQKRLEGIQEYYKNCVWNQLHIDSLNTFEDVLTSLEGLIRFLSDLRQQLTTQFQKICEYDRLKSMVKNHNQIINSVQQSYQVKINQLYEQKNQQKQHYQQEIMNANKKYQQIQEKTRRLQKHNIQLSEKIQVIEIQLENLKKQLQYNETKYNLTKQKLSILLALKTNNQPKIINKDHLTLTNIFYYKKLRTQFIDFLSLSDICNIGLLNKEFHFLINISYKHETMLKIIKENKSKLNKAKENSVYYQKIYEKFAEQNIHQSALKYLFFKSKPGVYMLPFFQQNLNEFSSENSIGDLVEQQKTTSGFRNSMKSLFQNKKKKQQETKFSLIALKDEKQFRIIQQKIQTFFQSIFQLKLPSDLHNFTKLMTEQLSQLKENLKFKDKSMQLLCFSKFMYYQLCEIHNLLQVCFGLLVKETEQRRHLSAILQDKNESENGLRSLVDELIKDKVQMQKRVWKVESEIVVARQEKFKMEKRLREIQSLPQTLKQRLQKNEEELQKTKQSLENAKRKKKELQGIINLIKEDLKDWNANV